MRHKYIGILISSINPDINVKFNPFDAQNLKAKKGKVAIEFNDAFISNRAATNKGIVSFSTGGCFSKNTFFTYHKAKVEKKSIVSKL